ncbi:helix-turn-helix domain-containing protein [Lacrimispora sp.]|uniref:helix-turn-helix domain-containing protein n=1 Tax=Lacrimispora sp. TaxID=2719234 RepID=UPI003992FDF6
MSSEQLKVISWPDKRCNGEYEICNWCGPENARWIGAKSELTMKAQEILHETFPRKFDLSSISNRLFVNKSYLCRVFKKETGKTLLQYYNEIRCEHARRLLIHSKLGLAYIAIQVGFCNLSQFCCVFKKVVGTTPCEYRKSYLKALKEK